MYIKRTAAPPPPSMLNSSHHQPHHHHPAQSQHNRSTTSLHYAHDSPPRPSTSASGSSPNIKHVSGGGGGGGGQNGNNNNNNNHHHNNNGRIDASDDLHAWSLYRQNLNANFSESAMAGGGGGGGGAGGGAISAASSRSSNKPGGGSRQSNKSSLSDLHTAAAGGGGVGSGRTETTTAGGGIPMNEHTVNNILSHPKYGAQLKNQDAFTYLRFGLPRAKVTTGSNNNNCNNNNCNNSSSSSSGASRQITTTSSTVALHTLATGEGITHVHDHHHPPHRSGAFKEKRLPASSEQFRGKVWKKSVVGGGAHLADSSNSDSADNSESLASNRKIIENEIKMDRSGVYGPGGAARAFGGVSRMQNHHHNSHQHLERPGVVRRQPMGSHQNLNGSEAGHFDSFSMSEGLDEDVRLDEVMSNPAGVGGGGGLRAHSQQHLPMATKHPHLVVKDLTYEVDKSGAWRRLCGMNRQKLRVFEDISFDVRAGELLAIITTTAEEGTALLSVLTNRHDQVNGMVSGEMYLNGTAITPTYLSRVAAFVSHEMSFCPDMSTRQALLFAGLLLGPADKAANDMKRRTRAILEELNLGEVRHARLSELTDSERLRLHVAIHLLLDTELLILDQPLARLDIFDAFFLVEYLRHWALVGNRCVVMTCAPPTYEIYNMMHRVLLISAGRSLFVGPRRDMVKYFTGFNFPCPPFKNPSDFYLDLVTIDDLSQEALIESNQRLEELAAIHVRRPLSELFSSMPGPPSVTPAPYRHSNFAMQFLALCIRALIFSFPYNVVYIFKRLLVVFLLSSLVGGIYWQVRAGREQESVWDRLGFLATMLTIVPIPLMISELSTAYAEKKYILMEVRQGFYSLPVYVFAKMLYSLPQAMLTGLAYALPACSMAGLQHHTGHNSLPYYLLIMLAYYLSLRSLVLASVWSCRRRSTATIIFGCLFAVFVVTSGVNIHQSDMIFTYRWIRQLSPIRWVHEALVAWEFEPNAARATDGALFAFFLCSRNPVVQQPNAILVRADCGFQARSNILRWFEYQGGSASVPLRSPWHVFIALAVLYFVSFFVGLLIFCVRVYYFRQVQTPPKRRKRV